MLSQLDLKCRIVASPDALPRTDRLEKRIEIGVGYHGKWYRSQREHWLGWIVAKEHEATLRGVALDTISAQTRWRGLNCIPMMFWLAEAAGLEDAVLGDAEAEAVVAASEISHDCPMHGKVMRAALPWHLVETALFSLEPASASATQEEARAAFEHLAAKVSAYRKLKNRIDGK